MADVAPGKARGGGGLNPSALSRGSRLGRYELLAPIGSGGMAKVWAARQSGFGGFNKVVAIKSILPHLSREPDFERLFVDEARVASLVHHANVCEIYELAQEGQVLYLVMEWVDGDSLIKVIKPQSQVLAIDPRVAARIAADTCAGLHAAHIQVDHEGRPLKIVHRDVSPHNVLLSSDGNVKVTDFGVAKAVGQTHDHTMAGQMKGKLEYMSPEQVVGGAVDGRTDVFGVGAVLYECATGVQPFASSGDLEVMNKIVSGRITPPSVHVRGFPLELEAILLKAMANDRQHRFGSAEEMQYALESWIQRSGPPVGREQVAAVLHQRVGAKIAERLSRIRVAMGLETERSPSHTPSSSGVITTSPRIAPPPPSLPRGIAPPSAPRPQAPAAPRPQSAFGPRPQAPAARPMAVTAKVPPVPDTIPPESDGFGTKTVADMKAPVFLAAAHFGRDSAPEVPVDEMPIAGSEPATLKPMPAPVVESRAGSPLGLPTPAVDMMPLGEWPEGGTVRTAWTPDSSPSMDVAPTSRNPWGGMDPMPGTVASPTHGEMPPASGMGALPNMTEAGPEGMTPPTEQSATDLSQYLIAAAVGVVVAAVVGSLAFLVWRFVGGGQGSLEPPAAPPSALAAATPAPAPPPVPSGYPYIAFRVVPGTATIYIDGQAMSGGGRTIPRLRAGEKATATFRADGYDDVTLKLDETVNGTVDVVLSKQTIANRN